MALYYGDEWAKMVCEAFGIDHQLVSRLVIDCLPSEPLKVYISCYGTDKLLQIRPPVTTECKIVVLEGK